MPKATTFIGMTTLAAVGPLSDAALEESTLRVCDRGHVAIAWRDDDGPRCVVCARMGTLSGVLCDASERASDEVREVAEEAVQAAERDEESIRDAARDARESLRRFLDREEACKLPDAVFDLARAAYDTLCNAL